MKIKHWFMITEVLYCISGIVFIIHYGSWQLAFGIFLWTIGNNIGQYQRRMHP